MTRFSIDSICFIFLFYISRYLNNCTKRINMMTNELSIDELLTNLEKSNDQYVNFQRLDVISWLLEPLVTPLVEYMKKATPKCKPNQCLVQLSGRSLTDDEHDQRLRKIIDEYADKVGITDRNTLQSCLYWTMELDEQGEGQIWLMSWLKSKRKVLGIDKSLDDKNAFDTVMNMTGLWKGFSSDQREIAKKIFEYNCNQMKEEFGASDRD